IDDDDKIAAINVRGKRGLMLAAQNGSHLAGQPPEGLAFGVDHIPLPLHVLRIGHVSLVHGVPSYGIGHRGSSDDLCSSAGAWRTRPTRGKGARSRSLLVRTSFRQRWRGQRSIVYIGERTTVKAPNPRPARPPRPRAE